VKQMAALMAATPAFAKAMKAFNDKQSKFDGTAIRTKMTFETVAGSDPSTQQSSSSSSGLGGLLGRMKRRKNDESGSSRGTMFDSNHELLKASTGASADAVAIPAGFKQE
jgi:hypothetical protein